MSPTITIIGLENQNNDGGTASILARKIQSYYGLTSEIRVPNGKRLKQLLRKNSLEHIVKTYCKDDNAYVIFVLDFDCPMSKFQREQETNSLLNQITAIVSKPEFHDSVFFCPALWELEAWLLVDCEGICCYYLSRERQQYNESNCRDQIKGKKPSQKALKKLIGEFQKGNTEHLMEPLPGKKGVKEHLIKFSTRIMQEINSNKKNQRIKRDKKYHEHESPIIARYLQINRETMRRNNSLQDFANVIRQCAELRLEESDELN